MKIRRIEEIEVQGLGQKIKQARLSLPKNGKSLDQLCDEAGISRTSWYNIEHERLKDGVSEDLLHRIELALGVDLGIKFDE